MLKIFKISTKHIDRLLLFLCYNSPKSIDTDPQRISTHLRMRKCMKDPSDCPCSRQLPEIRQSVPSCSLVIAHVTSLELRARESGRDHLRCLPIMWLDILSWSPITFELFTEKYPHDTSSKLSRHQCSPNPPHSGIKREGKQKYSWHSYILGWNYWSKFRTRPGFEACPSFEV